MKKKMNWIYGIWLLFSLSLQNVVAQTNPVSETEYLIDCCG